MTNRPEARIQLEAIPGADDLSGVGWPGSGDEPECGRLGWRHDFLYLGTHVRYHGRRGRGGDMHGFCFRTGHGALAGEFSVYGAMHQARALCRPRVAQPHRGSPTPCCVDMPAGSLFFPIHHGQLPAPAQMSWIFSTLHPLAHGGRPALAGRRQEALHKRVAYSLVAPIQAR
jgi:hypothetical protein